MPTVEWDEVVNLGAQGRGGHLVTICVVFCLTAMFLTFNRLYWRIKIAQGLGWLAKDPLADMVKRLSQLS